MFSGRAVQHVAVAREADRLLTVARLADARDAVGAFLALYPPTLAGAVAFAAYAQDVCCPPAGAGAAGTSAGASAGAAPREIVRQCAQESAHLAQRAPLCHRLGRLRALAEGQCVALDRMLAPVLAARAFRGCYDRRRRCCVVAPAATPAQLDALCALLARLEAAVLAYNNISPSALSQEKLLRQCVAIAAATRTHMQSSSPTSSSPLRETPALADEQTVLCAHALLCRRLAQVAHLLALLHGAAGAALARVRAADRAWLHECTLHDLALTERGNAAVARIVSAAVDAALARPGSDPAALFARLSGELSLFFTRDSLRVFAAKRQFLRLQRDIFLLQAPSPTSSSSGGDTAQHESKSNKDSSSNGNSDGSIDSLTEEAPREVQGIVEEAMGQLLACSALELSDLEAAVAVLCRAHCPRDAVVLVRTCSQRADPDNLAAKYQAAHTGVDALRSALAEDTDTRKKEDSGTAADEEGRQQYAYRARCYELLLGLLDALSGRVRKDCSLPADMSVLTAGEVAFRDLLVLTTAGAADALWLERLLQWLAARAFTHMVLQLDSPAVVRFLERHARRDVLLPSYYALHGDALNGARALYAAATAPTMPCTLEQREGSLLLAQRLARECPALAPGVAALTTAIAAALASLRFQQRVRAALRELCQAPPGGSSTNSTSSDSVTTPATPPATPAPLLSPEEYARASAELTADIYPVAALVATYVQPLRLTELELLALAAVPPPLPRDAPARARALWPRLLRERCAADPRLAARARATVVHLCAALPPELVPLPDIVRALEAHRARLLRAAAPTYRDLQALPSAVDVLLAAKAPAPDLLVAYAPLCTGTGSTASASATATATETEETGATEQCVCVQSLLCLVGTWLEAARPALRAPHLADDLAQATAVLRVADRAVLALVRTCAAALRARDTPLAAETAARCDAAAADIDAVRSSEALRHALQYQRLP